ncbi:MAG: hypothetical protein GPJ54_09310 [Candidatus Heimdallarchaeota archaeon]|nr:hypothetical protein [Candidatus Heimdallarchaeota archaeon]
MSSDSYHFDFEPEYFRVPKLVIDEITDVIHENLIQINTVEDIIGLTMIRYDGKQPIVFSPDEITFDYLKTLGEIISTMEPVSYFKNLSRNFEFKGIGHLNFEDFDIYLVKIDTDLLLTIMATESTNRMFKTCQNFADQLYQVFKTQRNDEKPGSESSTTTSQQGDMNDELGTFARFNREDKDKKPKKSKAESKSDLKKMLRGKLDGMDPK